jgi:hypothetical protein
MGSSMKARQSIFNHRQIFTAAILAACILPVSFVAAKADCKEDIDKIMQRRMGEVALLNKISKANGGKLDPIAACPRLRSLAVVEAEATAYFTKNKDWCNLPPDFVDKMSAAHTKTVGFAAKACSFAVKIKQAQQQQAQQQQEMAPKLPAGPL